MVKLANGWNIEDINALRSWGKLMSPEGRTWWFRRLNAYVNADLVRTGDRIDLNGMRWLVQAGDILPEKVAQLAKPQVHRHGNMLFGCLGSLIREVARIDREVR